MFRKEVTSEGKINYSIYIGNDPYRCHDLDKITSPKMCKQVEELLDVVANIHIRRAVTLSGGLRGLQISQEHWAEWNLPESDPLYGYSYIDALFVTFNNGDKDYIVCRDPEIIANFLGTHLDDESINDKDVKRYLTAEILKNRELRLTNIKTEDKSTDKLLSQSLGKLLTQASVDVSTASKDANAISAKKTI